MTNKMSFYNLTRWKAEFLEKAAPTNTETFPIFVVGNKIDLEDRQVP